MANQTKVSARQFKEMVAEAAYRRFMSHNCPAQVAAAKRTDWFAAGDALVKVGIYGASHQQIARVAEVLATERVSNQRLADWVSGESAVSQTYVVW